jgi:hypothetical protein
MSAIDRAGRRAAPLLCGLALLLTGCGPSRRVAIQGTVTYRGAPLEEGTILFEPADPAKGYSAGARVEAGAYAIPAEKGLLPGPYRVQVSAPGPSRRKPPPGPGPGAVFEAGERLPAKYNRDTELTAEVTARGPNRLDFNLD